jgi:hypothetical protein
MRPPVRRSLLVTTAALLLAVSGTVVLLQAPRADAFEGTADGTLTRGDRVDRFTVTAQGGTFDARLRFQSVPPRARLRPLTARLELRNGAGDVVASAAGVSALHLVARVPDGSYRLRVSTTKPLRTRDLAYRLTVAPPSPAPAPTGLAASCGTWVLQQVSSAADLVRLRGRIESALALPGVVGLSVRFPWDAADLTGNETTDPILDTARAIADGQGKALSIRFMAGRHTPARVFAAGAAFYVNDGSKVPLPWDNATGRHQVFLDAYDAYVGKLAAWSRANRVHLLHLSWYGQDWAELNHGAGIRATPGYSLAAWLRGHRELIDVGASHAGSGLSVEVPLSGYGPLSDGQSAALADEVVAQVGANDPRFLVQANGWGPTQEWGSPTPQVEASFDEIWSKPVQRGLQMIQPDGYDWAKVFGRLDVTGALYGEVYLPSFWQVPGPTTTYNHNTPERIASLEDEIRNFAARSC